MTNRLRVAALVLASALALLVVGALSTAGTNPAHAQTASERFVPGEVLVKFEPGTSGEERAAAHRQNDAEVEEIIPDIGVRVVEVPVGQEKSAVAAYERNPNVSYAELDTIVRVADHCAPLEEWVCHQWQYHHTKVDSTGQEVDAPDIDAFEAWQVTEGTRVGDPVAIAILDTGIDQDHPDLSSKIDMNRNFTNSDTVDDQVGHGTHVAGSAAAVTNNGVGVAGTCPDCRLYNAKVIGDNSSGRLSWLARGITWAADPDNNPDTDDGAEVISMSLGTSSGSDTLREAVNFAWRKNAVLVAAAGNYSENDPYYPAAYEPNAKVIANVIAVAATNRKDAKPKFSNYGKKWVDIGAPGVEILSTAPNHPNDIWRQKWRGDDPPPPYGTLNGTSMATPHVAGVAGLVWAATDSSGTNPLCSTNECVRDRILAGADKIPRLADYWPNGRRLNAYGAVAPPPSSP